MLWVVARAVHGHLAWEKNEKSGNEILYYSVFSLFASIFVFVCIHICMNKLPILIPAYQSFEMVTTKNTDYEFLGAVTSSQVNNASAGGQPWMVNFQVNNQLMKFNIHSCADVTVIVEVNYLEARDGILQSPKIVLRVPTTIPFSVSGKFHGQL